ncbi:hypothetical protein EKD04_020655 [Chloroflexales bacterium ZM16-3]|nr:hypothetical protein [Chloroflexales bacterium ZM16-3]
MNTLIFYGLVVIVGLAVVRVLFPARPTQPQVIYVVAKPPQARGGLGCLPLVVAGIVIIVALRLFGAG